MNQPLEKHASLPFEMLNFRHVTGKANGKQYTAVEGVVTLPDGKRTSCEAFLDGQHHFQGNAYRMDIRFGVDDRKRLSVRVVALTPVQAQPGKQAA